MYHSEQQMNHHHTNQGKKSHNTDPVQHDITVGPDNKGIVQYDCIEKSCLCSVFLCLKFVKRTHQQGILGMAFNTPLHCFVLWHDPVCNQQAVVWPGMTFNASYLAEMQSLVRQPVMLLNNVISSRPVSS
jgi:hypothetical protein